MNFFKFQIFIFLCLLNQACDYYDNYSLIKDLKILAIQADPPVVVENSNFTINIFLASTIKDKISLEKYFVKNSSFLIKFSSYSEKEILSSDNNFPLLVQSLSTDISKASFNKKVLFSLKLSLKKNSLNWDEDQKATLLLNFSFLQKSQHIAAFKEIIFFKSQKELVESNLSLKNPVIESISVNDSPILEKYGRDEKLNLFMNFKEDYDLPDYPRFFWFSTDGSFVGNTDLDSVTFKTPDKKAQIVIYGIFYDSKGAVAIKDLLVTVK